MAVTICQRGELVPSVPTGWTTVQGKRVAGWERSALVLTWRATTPLRTADQAARVFSLRAAVKTLSNLRSLAGLESLASRGLRLPVQFVQAPNPEGVAAISADLR